jgi:hypothetical protein
VFGSLVWYSGCALAALGVFLTIRPIRRMGGPTRRAGASLTLLGVGLAILSAATGGSLQHGASPATLLDRYMPIFQFDETHAIEIQASADETYAAIFAVTPNEIALFRTLTWIRRFGRQGEVSILNAPSERPLMETALATSFRKIAERPNEELVVVSFAVAPQPRSAAGRIWTADAFIRLEEPGYAKTAMNFRVEPAGPGRVILRTETRVYATDAVTRRVFTAYWRTIYPGSAIIRRMWLRAIKTRAERHERTGSGLARREPGPTPSRRARWPVAG